MKILLDFLERVRASLRAWRRSIKERLPYVRRREFRKLQAKYARVTLCFLEEMRYASRVDLIELKHVEGNLTGEACLFVSYAPKFRLKGHVRWHVEHLLDAGVQVVLIVNTDTNAQQFEMDEALIARLSGCYVRKNLGFDFAAWAHIHGHLGSQLCCDRLYLLNDSVVGPVEVGMFQRMMERIRYSTSDVIGLTENSWPSPHLQSFFLVFNRRALDSDALRGMLENMLALPTKEMVIDVYETQLSNQLKKAGLTVEAMFPTLATSPYDSNDTFFRWEELVRIGFPYVKASVVDHHWGSARLRDTLPAALLANYRKPAP